MDSLNEATMLRIAETAGGSGSGASGGGGAKAVDSISGRTRDSMVSWGGSGNSRIAVEAEWPLPEANPLSFGRGRRGAGRRF